jgi:hypothetical protein
MAAPAARAGTKQRPVLGASVEQQQQQQVTAAATDHSF